MRRWQAKILALLNIHTGEGKLVGLVLAYAILLYASNVLARTASYALFLGSFDAATLPYSYVGISIAAPLVASVYLRLNHRYPLSTVLLIVHSFLFITLAIYGLTLGKWSASWLVFSLPIYFGVNNSLTISSFWNLLGRIYNLQQGKRLFGMLSSGEHIATIATGFITPFLVRWLGTINLFWVAAFLMTLTVALLMVIFRGSGAKMKEIELPEPESGREQRGLFSSPYVRLITALFTLFIIGVYFVDNIFFSQAELRYTNEDQLAAFIAIFMAAFGVLSLLVQIFVAGRVLTRFGVRAMILATPAGLLLFMVPFAIIGVLTDWVVVLFWLIVSANMYRSILDAVDSAAVNVMYQPLPAHQRTQAQTVVIGIVYPLAIGVTGLILLFFTNVLGFSPVMLSFVLIVILVIWLWMALKLGRAYPQQVQQALSQRIFQGGRELSLDEAGIRVLRQGLSSSDEGVVMYALDTLSKARPDLLNEILPELLNHPLPEIRQVAIQRIESIHLVEVLPAVHETLFSDPSASVRASALYAVAKLDEATAVESLPPFLDDPEQAVRLAALISLLRGKSLASREGALRRLAHLSNSLDDADRILAVQAIGRVKSPNLQPVLGQLLADHSVVVRREALSAAGKAGYMDLWPLVIGALDLAETRRAAAAALVEGGAMAATAIRDAFETDGHSSELFAELAYIAGRIGGDDMKQLLFEHLHYPDAAVRAQILSGLMHAGFRAEANQRTAVRQQVKAEGTRAAACMAALADLQHTQLDGSLDLLTSVLQRQLTQHTENIFLLLSFVYDRQPILRAWEVLRPGSRAGDEPRAYALESIETLVAKEEKRIVLPLVSSLTLSEKLARLNGIYQREPLGIEELLRELMASPSPFLQLCALYSLGKVGFDHAATIQQVRMLALDDSASPILRETAAWVLSQIEVEKAQDLLDESLKAEVTRRVQAISEDQVGGHGHLPAMTKLEMLKKARLFADADENSLLGVAAQLVELRAVTGEALFAEGDGGDSMYIIVSGSVRIHKGLHILNDLGPADAFGEMALLEPEPRSASAVLLEPTHLLRLDRDIFLELLNADPAISRGIIRVLSRFLRESVRNLAQLADSPSDNGRITDDPSQVSPTIAAYNDSPVGRMMMLKRVDMFRYIPDSVLVELVYMLAPVDVNSGEEVFQKGEPGDAMYIIAGGRVRVHDRDRTINYLGPGEIFGEMALLDPEPRLASVTAVEPTRLLRLDQEPFAVLLEDHPELAAGIIRNLSQHLRARVRDLAE